MLYHYMTHQAILIIGLLEFVLDCEQFKEKSTFLIFFNFISLTENTDTVT